MGLFSERESEILKLLGRRKVSIIKLASEYFDEPTIDANTKISTAIYRINKKCEHYNLPWFINGEGGGRQGKVVWKERR